jgi:hypothetical protein
MSGTPAPNQTSAAVKAALRDSTTTQIATQTLENARAKIDGTLFALPGGDVRIAFGGEYSHYTLQAGPDPAAEHRPGDPGLGDGQPEL